MTKATIFRVKGVSDEEIQEFKNLESYPIGVVTKKFLKHPNPAIWPHYPFLPVIKKEQNHFPKLGLILAGNPTKVFLGNLYLLPTTLEEFLKLPAEEFKTVDDMIASGWYID